MFLQTIKSDMQTLVSLGCTFDDEGKTCLFGYPEATATLDEILAFVSKLYMYFTRWD